MSSPVHVAWAHPEAAGPPAPPHAFPAPSAPGSCSTAAATRMPFSSFQNEVPASAVLGGTILSPLYPCSATSKMQD